MTKDEALKLALEALEGIQRYGLDTLSGRIDGPDDREWQRAGVNEMTKQARLAITAIKEALSQEQEQDGECKYCTDGCPACDARKLPEQEPVAWEQFYPDIGKPQIAFNAEVIGYVAPQRTWVGLTAKEKHEFRYSHMTTADFIEDIEAKLKDKNTRGQE